MRKRDLEGQVPHNTCAPHRTDICDDLSFLDPATKQTGMTECVSHRHVPTVTLLFAHAAFALQPQPFQEQVGNIDTTVCLHAKNSKFNHVINQLAP